MHNNNNKKTVSGNDQVFWGILAIETNGLVNCNGIFFLHSRTIKFLLLNWEDKQRGDEQLYSELHHTWSTHNLHNSVQWDTGPSENLFLHH